MSFDPADPIGSVFAGVVGKRAWLVRKGYGSFLTMEFGEPHLEVREPIPGSLARGLRRPSVTVRGDWHLWVYCCEWTITEGGAQLAHSESDDREIERVAHLLNGLTLLAVDVDPVTAKARFRFELETELTTATIGPEYECWMLYAPDGRVFALRGDASYSIGPGDVTPADQTWVPLPQ